MNLKKLLNSRSIRNAGWLIGGRLVDKLLAFLVGVLTARYLGSGQYGLISYATAYTTFFASVCTLGINSIIIKNFVDHPEEEGQAMGTTFVLRALSSLLSGVMVVGIVSIVDRGEPTTILVAALSSIGMFFQAFGTFRQWFQSRLQSKYVAIATAVSYIAVSAYKIVLLVTGKGVMWFALSTSVSNGVLAVILLIAYKSNGGQPFSFSMQKAKQLLSASAGFIVSGLMVSVYGSTDKLMLKQMLDEEAVGYYAIAMSLSTTWTFLLQAVIDSAYPSILQSHVMDPKKFQKRNRQLYALVLYAALVISMVICVLAKPIVTVLYGQEYLPVVAPTRIVVWYTAFSYLGVARNAWLVCENKQKYLKYLNAGAAVTNVVLNLALIPLWGASGAALASLITQVVTVIILPAMIPDLRENAKLMLEAALLKDVLP